MLLVQLTFLLNQVIVTYRHICAATSSGPSSSCVWTRWRGHVRCPLPTPFWTVVLPPVWEFVLCRPVGAAMWASTCVGGIAGQAVAFFEVDFEGLGGDEHLLHTLAATITHIIME